MTDLTGVPALMTGLSVIRATIANAWRHRVLGLSAEAGFWQLLSLPAALLGVLGTIGYFADTIGQNTVKTLEQSILNAAGNVVNPSSVNTLVKPTVEAVLYGGKAEIVSVGFVLSLWSGSSAIATYVNTISIAYGQRDGRSAVRSRLLSLALYIVALIAGVVILPLLVVGPTDIDRIPWITAHQTLAHLISITYWPIVGGLSVLALAGLYRVAPPRPARWRAGLPGALVAVLLWFGGSIGLRTYVAFTFRRTAAYGALGAPVAILLFFYITALAVLLGAELNAEIGRRMAARIPADPRRTVPA